MRNSTKVGMILAGILGVLFVGLLCDNGIREGFIGKIMHSVPFNEITNMLFNQYGAVLLVLGGLMFGAIITGIAISKEEGDE